MRKADISIYHIGVMGARAALNILRHGFRVALINRSLPGKDYPQGCFFSTDWKRQTDQ